MAELCFPETAQLGSLSLDEVFLYHNGPRLFSCRNADTGALYLAVWAGDISGGDLWIVAPISNWQMHRLKKGELDIREAFTSTPKGAVFKICVSSYGDLASVLQIPVSQLGEDLLPEPGERLSPLVHSNVPAE